ncbi:MAG: hypothetical protein KGY99_04925 [Phycisphaerae bacterium]|nr:hypothetical protein [Phycisphaerae bacterium]
MNRKRMILILAPLAVAAFAGSYFLAGMFGVGSAPPPPESAKAPAVGQLHTSEPSEGGGAADVPRARERQLEQLIKDLKAKTAQRDRELKQLEQDRQRLALAQRDLDTLLRQFRELRTQITEAAGKLNVKCKQFEGRLVQIEAVERRNLRDMAGVYDRMDSTAAGKIITSWCQGGRIDDAVKLLHFMGDRQAANLLAAIADEPLAAQLTERLKRIQDTAPAEG